MYDTLPFLFLKIHLLELLFFMFKVVRISLLIQNSTVALSCSLVVVILLFKASFQSMWSGKFIYFIQGVLIMFNVVSNLASMCCKIALEKDWTVVIAKNVHVKKQQEENGDKEPVTDTNNTQYKSRLASMNATMRRIDLITSIVAPLTAGLIMSFFNISTRLNGIVLSAVFFAAWNMVSFLIEYSLLASVNSLIPDLTKSQIDMKIKEKQSKSAAKLMNPFLKIYQGWSLYIHQGLVLIPSIAFAFLFLTVLSFDSITIGYAKSQHVTETFISLSQGLGSIFGVLGTAAFPLLHNKFKMRLSFIGIIGSLYQFTFLVLCVVSIWLPGSPFYLSDKFFGTHVNKCENNMTLVMLANETIYESFNNTVVKDLTKWERIIFESPCREYMSILFLMLSMALSRFGLWLTDLTINQIIQESVKESERGVIGGVQGSLNRIFDLIKYVCVVFLSDVRQYGYLVIISASSIFTAICLYMVYVVLQVTRGEYSPVSTSPGSANKQDEESAAVRKSMIQIYKGQEDDIDKKEAILMEKKRAGNDDTDFDDYNLSSFEE